MQNVYTKDRDTETIDKAKDYASAAMQQGEDRLKSLASDAQKKLKEGQEQLSHLVDGVNKQLKDNPWPVVAGVAAGCLLLGFLMGTSKSKG